MQTAATEVIDDNDGPPEPISRLKRDRAFAKLRNALAIAPDERFLQMLWCVHALFTGREDRAVRALSFPSEAVGAKMGSKHSIHPWELETLANQLLLVPKRILTRYYPCDTLVTANEFTNYLRRLENCDFGVRRDRVDIFNELHRIGQRQFPWQRNMANVVDFYRPLYLYGQGEAAAYFLERYGLTVSDFAKVGFALFARYMRQPIIEGPPDFSVIGVSPDIVSATLRLISIEQRGAASELMQLVDQTGARRWPTAYQPSLLRRFPVITYDGQRHWCPLPELLLQRVTFGLYYDVMKAGAGIRNEISKRFESYCSDLLAAQMPGFQVLPEYRYAVPGRKGGQDSPDILVEADGALSIVIECKATKLTLAAQYSDNPIVDAEARYAEIGKGVFQIWRFMSHCRRGLTPHAMTPSIRGVVLTLDTWMVLSRSLQEHVRGIASLLADADGDILPEDRRPVVFAAVQDFERVLALTDERGFLANLDNATEERFLGWLLPDVQRETRGGQVGELKPYPFDPGEILPWWNDFGSDAE